MLVLVTVLSIVVAVVMSIVAWRATREERRRSDARVAALAADIHQSLDLDLRPATSSASAEAITGTVSSQPMFAPESSKPTAGRWGLALATGGLIVATAAAAAIVFTGDSPTASPAPVAQQPTATTTPSAPTAPLELVTLAHERDGDSLTVRGVVHNPSSGSEMDRLVAVVFLFNRDGEFLASGRAAVESSALIPGGQSSFVVTVPTAGEVGRYRVSFRSDDRVISHVDKRNRS
jgi:hypothetical protein